MEVAHRNDIVNYRIAQVRNTNCYKIAVRTSYEIEKERKGREGK